MAIYHCSLRVFTRSEGHSAVAAAAYRSGSILKDERAGRIHRYEKRKGVVSAFILAPNSAPEKLLSRASLWNAAEASENRKNSRVAREVILALPHELSDKARDELARDMGLYLMERYRVAVDVAIHSPVTGDGHDPRNHHAHLLFTTRELTSQGFGAKTRILDDKVTGPQEVEVIREVWETLANDALGRAGFEDVKIDRRTLEDQGIDRIPQTHVGPTAKNVSDERSIPKDILKEQFARQSEGEGDEDDADDGEGAEGKTSSSGGGGAAVKLQSQPKEDHKGRTIDYKQIDKTRTRLDFNEEIKALNARRAGFGDIPLKDQIKAIEKLTSRLETRQTHLKKLLAKSSLPHVIRAKIEATLAEFKDTLFASEKPKLTAEEKQARKERQKARYNRTYRTGLHERMREMKTSMDTLEQKRDQAQRFKAFIDKIEGEIQERPKAAFKKTKPHIPTRRITPLELSTKLALRAEFIREHIPERFNPAKLAFKTSTAIKPPEAKATFTMRDEPAKPLPQVFKQQTAPPPKAETQTSPSWKQSMPVRFKALDEVIAAQQIGQPKIQQRPNWYIPATDKTRPLQQTIDRTIRETRATQQPFVQREPTKRTTAQASREKIRAEAQTKRERVPPQYRPKTHEPERPKGKDKVFFKDLERERAKRAADQKGESLRSKFNAQKQRPAEAKPEPKTVKNEDVINRTKAKAEKLRSKIPPQYRAKPYETVKKAAQSAKSAVKNAWESAKAGFRKSKPEATARTKMSDSFNTKSGFNQKAQAPDHGPNDSPETGI